MDQRKKTAIFYITNSGLALAQRLEGLYPDAVVLKFRAGILPDLWREYSALVFIMASGIVVRTIAPLIKDKKTDPAVVVLDEKGEFAVSLVGGHIGGANNLAKDIAAFLGGKAVITTASDVNDMPAIDLWARDNDLVIENSHMLPQTATHLINNGSLNVYAEIGTELPDEFIRVSGPELADVIISNKTYNEKSERLYIRPGNLIVGIGCNSATSADEIEASIRKTLDENSLSFSAIHSLATIDKKGNEPGLVEFAGRYGLDLNTFTPEELNTVQGITKSKAAFDATGANAVAEPAALLATGSDTLLVPKQRIGNVTVAVAETKGTVPDLRTLRSEVVESGLSPEHGKLFIVGTGPGSLEHITPYAQKAIRESEVIVGYGTYLKLIPELTAGKEVHSTGMTKETERCKKAVELAMTGKRVAVISGGDPGIYAMAGLVFEILKSQESEGNEKFLAAQLRTPNSELRTVYVEVIPGISALNACAARLGAPLMHDFASISLSDRLTPWDLIEKRLAAAAMADFVVALYNPKSVGRPEHIKKARAIFLKYRSSETPVGIVKAAMRDEEKIVITNLRDMLNHDIDMQTTVIIGNSNTLVWEKWMITPRGYGSRVKN